MKVIKIKIGMKITTISFRKKYIKNRQNAVKFAIEHLQKMLKKLDGEKEVETSILIEKEGCTGSTPVLNEGFAPREASTDSKPSEPLTSKIYEENISEINYQQGKRIIERGLRGKEPTDDIANITQIIEIYDNGHENIFYPNEYSVIKKADLEKIRKYNNNELHRHRKYLINEVLEKYLKEDSE